MADCVACATVVTPEGRFRPGQRFAPAAEGGFALAAASAADAITPDRANRK